MGETDGAAWVQRVQAAMAGRPHLGRFLYVRWREDMGRVEITPASWPVGGAELWLRWAEELQDGHLELYQGRDHVAISVLGVLDGVPVELCDLVYERTAEILLEGRRPQVDQVVPGRIEALRQAAAEQAALQRSRGRPRDRYAYRGRVGAPHRRVLQLAAAGQLACHQDEGGRWQPYALPRGDHRYVPALVEAGLLEITPRTGDPWRARYRLTDAGRHALAQAEGQ